MGRATIIGGGEDGRYTIEVDLGQAQKASMLAAINAAISRATTNIATATISLSTATSEVVSAASKVDDAVQAYVLATQESDDPETWKEEIAAHEAALKVLREKQAFMFEMQVQLHRVTATKAELTKRLNVVQSISDTISTQAWCADLTEDATGEVATIEIPGEQELILIAPEAPLPGPFDGQLVARGVQSPEQAYFNAAILPGWQKYLPTYRTGVISNINTDDDTADVALDAATSSAQSLNVNQTDALTAVPVQYMECNAGAFQEGDNVVVKFTGQDWADPKVVGFVTDPRACALITLNGEFNAYAARGYWKGLVNPATARQIVENRGTMTIVMNGTTLSIYDFSLADPSNIWCEWAMVGAGPDYYVRFSSGAIMSPCGKAEFLCYNDLTPNAFTLQISRDADLLVDVAFSCPLTTAPSPPFGYTVCQGTPATVGDTATFIGTGVQKQSDQTWITVTLPP